MRVWGRTSDHAGADHVSGYNDRDALLQKRPRVLKKGGAVEGILLRRLNFGGAGHGSLPGADRLAKLFSLLRAVGALVPHQSAQCAA
jgi:hypothetical protein